MSLAVFGVLAAVVALSAIQPEAARADGCDQIADPVARAQCDARHRDAGLDSTDSTHSHGSVDTGMTTPADATIDSSSTSASAAVELKLAVKLTVADVAKLNKDGGSIELYLEDDFVVPDSIDGNDVYFTVAPSMVDTGSGGRVRAQYGVVVNDGDFYDGDDDWAIQVFIPDLQKTVGDGTVGTGFQGPTMGDTITLVITQSAGIKNPSEAERTRLGSRFWDRMTSRTKVTSRTKASLSRWWTTSIPRGCKPS